MNMAIDSKIQWTEATWNPLAGCTAVSPGCANCYAATMAHRLQAMGQDKYAGTTRHEDGKIVWTGRINLDDASRLGCPRPEAAPSKGRRSGRMARGSARQGVSGMTRRHRSAKAILAGPTEAEFTAQVIALARRLGWRVAHFRAARTDRGWRTPVQGDGAGFPDLVLARPAGHLTEVGLELRPTPSRQIIFAELKTDTGRVSPEQQAWLDASGGVVWRPRDWNLIVDALTA
jgi:Protein of unknown function (DUF5131)/VRR-NUC domain